MHLKMFLYINYILYEDNLPNLLMKIKKLLFTRQSNGFPKKFIMLYKNESNQISLI